MLVRSRSCARHSVPLFTPASLRSSLIHRICLRPTTLLQLYNGDSVKLSKGIGATGSSVVPYEAMARLLSKAKFTAHFTPQEIAEVCVYMCVCVTKLYSWSVLYPALDICWIVFHSSVMLRSSTSLIKSMWLRLQYSCVKNSLFACQTHIEHLLFSAWRPSPRSLLTALSPLLSPLFPHTGGPHSVGHLLQPPVCAQHRPFVRRV